MRPPTDKVPWYIEERAINNPEKISLDLARHLARRSAVGTVVVVTHRPAVLLPVIRKRWMKVIREVERQLSSTLNHLKRDSLQREILRMQRLTFAANTAYLVAPADVIFTSPEHLYSLENYHTLYLLDSLEINQLSSLHGHLHPKGLLISYCNTPTNSDLEPLH